MSSPRTCGHSSAPDPDPSATCHHGRWPIALHVHARQFVDFDRDRWLAGPEAVAYGLAEEVIGGPVGAPKSGTPA
jgi:hypothetical protein